MRARGHRAFKLKVGFGDELDDRNLRAIREEFGQEVLLSVDANQAWDLESAIRQAKRFEAYDLSWIEEPLRADRHWREWNSLREVTSVPLAAGENLAGLGMFSDALAQGVLSVVQPDVAKWGGVSGCIALAGMIKRAGATYCPHYLGGGIGLLASAHLLAAAGGNGMLEVDVNENPLRDELCGPLDDVREGHASLSNAPGLGPAPDVGKLRRFRISEQRISVARSSKWRRLLSRLTFRGARQRYEPSKHYMRGPGPKARAKGTRSGLEKS
jgi:L-alanine-DL-glutamate epimerase-like enolase superfamily enzyme